MSYKNESIVYLPLIIRCLIFLLIHICIFCVLEIEPRYPANAFYIALHGSKCRETMVHEEIMHMLPISVNKNAENVCIKHVLLVSQKDTMKTSRKS